MEPEHVGGVLNECFTSAFSKKNDFVVRGFSKEKGEIPLQVSINKEELVGALVDLNVDKFPGPDKIYPRLSWDEGNSLLALWSQVSYQIIRGTAGKITGNY